jgi:HAMP domain-containing protein
MTEKKQTTPMITLDATDLHAPEALRLMARKHRVTNPKKADELEATAKSFETFRRAWLTRTPV